MYVIHFWHGMDLPERRSRRAQSLINKIESMTDMVHLPVANQYEWRGTLDQFHEEYGRPFIVQRGYRDGEEVNVICVTQHRTFGQR